MKKGYNSLRKQVQIEARFGTFKERLKMKKSYNSLRKQVQIETRFSVHLKNEPT
jgi:hypothetical protein